MTLRWLLSHREGGPLVVDQGTGGDKAPATPAAMRAARRLVERELEHQTGQEAEALFRGCARVFANLRESMGDDGCAALFRRAFLRAQAQHPALANIRGRTDCETSLEKVVDATESYGAGPTRAAVEALLAAVIDILARLIGEDMAIRIIDPTPPAEGAPRGTGT